MAHPQSAPLITPAETIKIQNQVPNKESVTISVGQEVEIHNEDNVPYKLPISYENGSNNDSYPLAVYLPAGGKLYLIGSSAYTCHYSVDTSSRSGSGKHPEDTGPYTIIVSSSQQ
jgi:hypothetical protein